jgi:hypothetical protein
MSDKPHLIYRAGFWYYCPHRMHVPVGRGYSCIVVAFALGSLRP